MIASPPLCIYTQVSYIVTPIWLQLLESRFIGRENASLPVNNGSPSTTDKILSSYVILSVSAVAIQRAVSGSVVASTLKNRINVGDLKWHTTGVTGATVTEGAGGDSMVFVKVRETYDLHTIKNKMSVIGIHTPNAGIIKRNFPGLLMQCKAYKPVSCDVKLACASVLPLDPLGVGTDAEDVAPEDVFNPLLYKAVSNFSMSQIESFIHANYAGWTARGDSLDATNDGVLSDDFDLYYGFLSDVHGWKHANPQSGLMMRDLKPLVYEQVYSLGGNGVTDRQGAIPQAGQIVPMPDGTYASVGALSFRGKAKSMPWLNTTTGLVASNALKAVAPGFDFGNSTTDPEPVNAQTGVPAPKIYCGLIIVPPSKLHELYYRMVVEWTLEFSQIRPLSEITTFAGVAQVGAAQHVIDYDFGESKVLTDSDVDLVDTTDGSGIHKVM